MAQQQSSEQAISLKGSAAIVTEFFNFGINNILYQRGIYPPEQFERTKQYGLTIMTTADESLKAYLENILKQLKEWLTNKSVQRVVLVLASIATKETLERWQFDVACDKSASDTTLSSKPVKEVNTEIASIIRQITASVTFLPVIDEPCSFEILIYTDKDEPTPLTWEESDAKYVKNAAEVFQLRSFSTDIHKVATAVTYRDES